MQNVTWRQNWKEGIQACRGRTLRLEEREEEVHGVGGRERGEEGVTDARLCGTVLRTLLFL